MARMKRAAPKSVRKKANPPPKHHRHRPKSIPQTKRKKIGQCNTT